MLFRVWAYADALELLHVGPGAEQLAQVSGERPNIEAGTGHQPDVHVGPGVPEQLDFLGLDLPCRQIDFLPARARL